MVEAGAEGRVIPIRNLCPTANGRPWQIGAAPLPGYPANGMVLVLEWNGQTFAVPSRCPHQGYDLAGADLNARGDLICPNHGCVYPLEVGNGFAFPVERHGDDGLCVIADGAPTSPPSQCHSDRRHGLDAENDALRLANKTLQSRIQDSFRSVDVMLRELEGRKRELEAKNSQLESLAGLVSRITESIRDILLVAGLDGRVTRVSQGAVAFFGVEAERLIGCDVDSLLHPADLERLRARQSGPSWSGRPLLYELIYAEENFEEEVALRSLAVPSGRSDPSEAHAAPHHLLHGSMLYDSCGKEEGIILLISNIRGVKQREQLAREREMERSLDLLRAMIANIDQGLAMFDREMRLVVWNHRYSELVDVPEEILRPGVSIETLFRYNAERGEYGAGDVEAVVAERMALVRKRQPHRFERERPNGLVLEVTGRQLPDGGLVTTYTDITERRRKAVELQTANELLEQRVKERTAELQRENDVRRRTEQALRDSRERLRGIADSLFEGVVVVNHRGDMIFANSAARQALDVMDEDIEGLPLDHILLLVEGGTDTPFESAPWRRVVTEGVAVRNDDGAFKTPGGTVLPVAYACSPLSADGGRRNAIISFRDIAALKVAQREAAQASRLASVGQLAAGIAHEINTPVQYIGNNLNFIGDAVTKLTTVLQATRSRPAPAEEDPAGRKLDFLLTELPAALQETLDGVAQISRIVLSMKEFSHPGTTTKSMTDINRALESTLTVSSSQWKHAATVVKDFDPALPSVLCHAGEINQVFLNLIVNAAHAIEGSGKPLPGTITVSTSHADGGVEIRVRDSGLGIPRDIVDRIFDPFFTTKEVGKGTGQGLVICRDIVVKKHGGRIEVEGRPGEGAVFTVRLPVEGGEPRGE